MFYSEALADPAILPQLATLKITEDELNAALPLISNVEVSRAEFRKENGESQVATKVKDTAFKKMDK